MDNAEDKEGKGRGTIEVLHSLFFNLPVDTADFFCRISASEI
jgi:hypothetical protein